MTAIWLLSCDCTVNLGGDLLQGCFAVALFALGIMVAVQGVGKLLDKTSK